ncbi:putative RNA polymerase II subunit B1 CTD phosphatase RPAP2 [Ostrinia furnacalis]|uniref:putative RNA polymerase II subunit B1 CTD phosphatase RPAP2 n=1 Tax=Ostrinia furnacalis TaxID=93504 RepID=UPI0010386F2B|nr:putative RNA polymerase II subunit B1 CTD phosphatase RPAP2 [Ostrinia furnacalis]
MEKPKKKPTKIEEMTKEQIRQAIVKKRECNAKAQNIVESLLEKNISEEYFLQCLPDINQCHFEDVVEERAILHMCGYPLCQNILSIKDIPKQQYRISVKNNKVYDITTRKSFCSNGCYKSATYIKQQMLTSPLWFRVYEEIPKFNLLPTGSVGALGQEVDLGVVERAKLKTERPFTSINDFAQASINEITDEDNNVEQNTNESDVRNNQDKAKDTPLIVQENNNLITEANEAIIQNNQPTTIEKESKEQKKKPVANPLNIVGEIIEKPEQKIDPILYDTKTATSNKENTKTKTVLKKKQPVVTVLAIEVEKCLAQWFTIDTMLFLFGEEKVKEILADKGECIKEYLNNYANSTFYNSNNYDQYQALCKKLNMLELEDRRYDAQTLQKETKPLPDYSILQEESKKMQLKVRAFLAGETEIPDISTNVIEKPEEAPEEDSQLTQLPLVDKNAQNALRRRIVCEHLNKVLPDILKSLGLLSLSISSDVRLLVNTFKLKANNIMFKPIQWNLIAIIVIKLLSLRDKRLHYLLGKQTAYQHLQLLLLSYKQDGGYLDRLISWLTDIDRLLDTNDTQLTVE